MKDNSFQPPTIGAFYQCYKQPKALFSVLDSFRKYYPTSDVYIVCDAGDDHSAVAARFNCQYVYESARLGDAKSNVFTTPDKMIVYLKRLREAANHIKEDYVIILEDDVLIMNEVKEKLLYTENGINPHVHIGFRLTAFLKKRNPNIPFWTLHCSWGAFGGCIIDRRFIVEHFNTLEEDIADLHAHMPNILPYSTDIWITLLILYHGGSVGQYAALCETWWSDYQERKKLGTIAVLHQYKDLYE